MVRAKVCGVTNESDLRAVERAGADAVGVISEVTVDTPREVSLSRASALFEAASPFLTTTLVSMPASVTRAVELASAASPDVLQLHGDFDADEFQRISVQTDARVVAVVDAESSARARAVAHVVDGVLVDSVSEDGAGGTGETHDWTATAEVVETLDAPVTLAGGLTPENVAEAVRTVRPYAVDVASGVEAEGGVKDHDAVRAFVRNAKAAADASERARDDGGSEGDRDGEREVPS
ncbi:phosphoribosylanthranilate isomerase [Halopelagius longus]|uniref:N-(5'-phosphoribosyl)anthranilate isomerase n=1 Tax=Halopelagius longus TaxID=1236180 RepID=A0A1H0YCW5_9EURY|nr:phosphoribosylanthranilate isomerase [Halopelagius longus]RDI72415.1 phosphoribosylanthranilate isomerase [Halopelagius longus]SDQ12910.1 phosphoribosylanthranilate isomerase [Halopelagius longus]